MKKQLTWSIRFTTLLLCLFSVLCIRAQQASNVKGTVLDSNNEPLIGATVSVKGNPSHGSITDIDGNFNLQVQNSQGTLVVSYVGYLTQEIPLQGRLNLVIKMKEDAQTLDEVVVVGYGSQKRGHLTSAVSSINAKELMKAPMQNVSNLLTGKISGLTSIQASGKPGDDGTTLYVRGLNSFSNNGPMVIVDGVARPMDYVNPNDIASISILKDAAASIYGVQGANGVILITTKKRWRRSS